MASLQREIRSTLSDWIMADQALRERMFKTRFRAWGLQKYHRKGHGDQEPEDEE